MLPDVLASEPSDEPRRRRRGLLVAAAALALVAVVAADRVTVTHHRRAADVAAARAVRVGPAGYGSERFALRVDNPSARPFEVATVSVTLRRRSSAVVTSARPGATVGAHGTLVVRFPFDAGTGCRVLRAGAGVVRLRVVPPGGHATDVRRSLPRFPTSPLGAAWETALGVFRCPAG